MVHLLWLLWWSLTVWGSSKPVAWKPDYTADKNYYQKMWRDQQSNPYTFEMGKIVTDRGFPSMTFSLVSSQTMIRKTPQGKMQKKEYKARTRWILQRRGWQRRKIMQNWLKTLGPVIKCCVEIAQVEIIMSWFCV